MAYKFQVGPAILSGSTTFEEAVSAASLSSVGASTAATLSASAGVSGASFDSDGDATFGTITMPGFAVDADGDVALKSLAVDNGSTIGADGDTDILTLAAQSAVLANDVDFNVAKVGGLQLAGAAVTSTAAELNLLDGVSGLVQDDFTKLAAVDATAAELNYLDNDDLSADDLQKLADITATAAEINDLTSNAVDSSDLTKLSEVTATSTELNLLDAVTRGSIVYGNGSGASAKLAKGAAHTFLQSDGTDISYVALSGDATLNAGVLTLTADSVDSAEIADGAIDLAHMSVNSVDSDQYVDGSIDTAHFAAGSVDAAAMGANSVDSSELVDGSVDLSHMSVNSVDSDQYVDGSIDLVHMSAESVDSDQYVDGSIDLVHMSADSVDSDQYVDGSIDTVHIADDQVTLAKMAGIARGKILVGDASGDPSALAAGADGKLLVADANGDPSWTTVSGDATLSAGVLTLTADSVDSAEITNASIDLAHMSADSVDSDQYVDGSIDTAHIADAQVTLAKMAANSVDSDQYVDSSIDTAHIADAQVTEAKLATSVAGVGLSGGGGSALAVDLNELVAEQVASGDFFAFVDSTDNGTHKETVDDLATLFAGNGLSAASAVMALDLNELTAAAINVANDSFAIIDADAANGSRKESFVDYASAIAGGGLTALNGGLLVTGNNVMAIADSGTLAAGYNIFADLSAPATVTLPASPDVGDSITVKGKGGVSQSNYIQIDRAGSSQLIDGEESVRIESVYGAVTMVYVGSDDWRIV